MGILLMGSVAFAQGTKPADKKMPPAKGTTTKTAPAKTTDTKVAPAKPAPAADIHMKKDGTPDKRFKENQHLKKDGTPDMRYKANKAKASKRQND